jgi:hypothetical protein
MKDAHKGRGVGDKEFGLVAGHVVSTMNELGVREDLIAQVAGALMSLKNDCVD